MGCLAFSDALRARVCVWTCGECGLLECRLGLDLVLRVCVRMRGRSITNDAGTCHARGPRVFGRVEYVPLAPWYVCFSCLCVSLFRDSCVSRVFAVVLCGVFAFHLRCNSVPCCCCAPLRAVRMSVEVTPRRALTRRGRD